MYASSAAYSSCSREREALLQSLQVTFLSFTIEVPCRMLNASTRPNT